MRVGLIFFVFLGASGVSLLAGNTDLQSKSLTVVAIGDSITAGTPYFKSPIESAPNGSGNPEGQYTYWVTRLRPAWRAVNCGINGQRSSQIRARFDDVFRFNPRYIVILAGVNDIYLGGPFQQVCANLRWMYKRALGKGVCPIAATLLPLDRASEKQSAEIRKLNTWIKRTAATLGIPIVDFHRALEDSSNPNRLKASPDTIHPDLPGYRQMGITLVGVIDKAQIERR